MLTDGGIEQLIIKDYDAILSQPIFTTRQLEGLKSISSKLVISDEKKKRLEGLLDEITYSQNMPFQARQAKIEAEKSQTSMTQISIIPSLPVKSLPDELIATILKSFSFYERLFYMSISKQFAKVINQMEFQEEYIYFKNSFVIIVNNLYWNQKKNYKNLKSIVGTTLENGSKNRNAIVNHKYDGVAEDLTLWYFVVAFYMSSLIIACQIKPEKDHQLAIVGKIMMAILGMVMMLLLNAITIIPAGNILYSKFGKTPAQSALQSYSLFNKNNDEDNNSFLPEDSCPPTLWC